MGFLEWLTRRRGDKLRRKVLNLEATVEARDRTIRILESERDGLAAVISRDRARVAAEVAEFARQRAESEAAK